MSRFSAVNLASLEPLSVLEELNFEDELALLKERLLRRAEDKGLDLSEVINLESDPLHVNLEAFAERIVQLKAEGNDQKNALTLAFGQGAELDHIGATYYGAGRLTVQAGDPDAIPPVDEVLESDADYRPRLALAPEAYTTAGTEGSYIYHALELDGRRDIADVVPLCMEDQATYSAGLFSDLHTIGKALFAAPVRANGDPVGPAEILLCILATREYGLADQALLDRVVQAIYPVRPLNVPLRAEPAALHTYTIEATLYVAPGSDLVAIEAAAMAAALEHRDKRRRIGAKVQRFGLGAAMKVPGVEELTLTQPAQDIDPGSKGYADSLVDPVITVEHLPEGWRP
ncbi:baseplate J/gp47 family protein [Cognatishimia sp. MH4019]|uniref:baseplate J/gp47 family protein n=1 Tax=Cognatishimia sp. MH4019 TaxID=2854030 RepID=UPI001CD6F642|nr:baseplate J/gp47 family protein [Cognatishimia sp. MH4019]